MTGWERAGRILLALFGAGFALLGVRYFADPAALTAETDVTIPSMKAMMEIRAVYGGMFVGVGLAILAMALKRALVKAGLIVFAILTGCVAAARVAAVALGQAPDPLFSALLAIEVAGVVLALAALRGIRKEQ